MGGFIVNVLADIFSETAGNNQCIIRKEKTCKCLQSYVERKGLLFLIDLSEGEAEHVLKNDKMVLQKLLKGYTSGRAKLLILSNFFCHSL